MVVFFFVIFKLASIDLIAQNLFSSHRMLSMTRKDERVDTFLNVNSIIITIRTNQRNANDAAATATHTQHSL